MQFNVRTLESGVRVVDPSGQLDHHTGTPRLQETLDPIKRIPGVRVIVNFSRVEYVCSAAVALLIEMHDKVADGGGRLVCCSVSSPVMEVLEILAIPEVIPCLASEKEAVAAVTGDGQAGK
jgi:anti-anti-sigma factor